MPQWQFKVLGFNSANPETHEHELQALGEERWELVSVTADTENAWPAAYLKRPKQVGALAVPASDPATPVVVRTECCSNCRQFNNVLLIRVCRDGTRFDAFFEGSPDGNGRIQWGDTPHEAVENLMDELRKRPFK